MRRSLTVFAKIVFFRYSYSALSCTRIVHKRRFPIKAEMNTLFTVDNRNGVNCWNIVNIVSVRHIAQATILTV